MKRNDRLYAAIDLKSFYASVECMALGRNSMTTNLVVADKSRTDKTICLAVSPSLKSYGLPGRLRLFEVIQAVKGINAERRVRAPGGTFAFKSDDIEILNSNPAAELDYIVAPPHMRKYRRPGSGTGLHRGAASHEKIYGSEQKNLLDLSEVCGAGGYICILDR